MHAHGGLFRTEDVAQRLLAAAIDTPVSVARTSGEGGAWGIALLACYLEHAAHDRPRRVPRRARLRGGLRQHVEPDPDDVAGFQQFLARFEAGLDVERAAVRAL